MSHATVFLLAGLLLIIVVAKAASRVLWDMARLAFDGAKFAFTLLAVIIIVALFFNKH